MGLTSMQTRRECQFFRSRLPKPPFLRFVAATAFRRPPRRSPGSQKPEQRDKSLNSLGAASQTMHFRQELISLIQPKRNNSGLLPKAVHLTLGLFRSDGKTFVHMIAEPHLLFLHPGRKGESTSPRGRKFGKGFGLPSNVMNVTVRGRNNDVGCAHEVMLRTKSDFRKTRPSFRLLVRGFPKELTVITKGKLERLFWK
jgi:hypothetical protein